MSIYNRSFQTELKLYNKEREGEGEGEGEVEGESYITILHIL